MFEISQDKDEKTNWSFEREHSPTITGTHARHYGARVFSVSFYPGSFKGTLGLGEDGGGGQPQGRIITRVAENKHVYNRIEKANKVIKLKAQRFGVLGG